MTRIDTVADHKRWCRTVATTATILLAACRIDLLGGMRIDAPVFEATTVAANPLNSLSAVVSVRVRDADSVAVTFRLADVPTEADGATPAVMVRDGLADIPVIGLLDSRHYAIYVVAYGPGGRATSSALQLSTDTLPSDLPRYVAHGADPDSGFVVFSAGRYGLAIDNTGRVVWYRRFADGAGLAFMAQPTGRYYTRPSIQPATQPAPWAEIDPLGNTARTLNCAGGLVPRVHDLIALADGSYWLMCDETRTMDLTSVGGIANARVTGTAIQHVSRDGALLFQWSPFEHFAIADGDPHDLVNANVNWTHGNAIDLAPDGNLIASFRNLGVVAKIDARSGDVLWRFGGRRNQFAVSGGVRAMFVGQHGARVYSPETLLLLDNLGDTTQSLGERYVLDEKSMNAQMVRSYGSQPGVVTQIGGSVQALPRGHTLVSFGTAGRVEEYDSAGNVVWRIVQGAGYVFRAQRIKSLYAPGVGTAR